MDDDWKWAMSMQVIHDDGTVEDFGEIGRGSIQLAPGKMEMVEKMESDGDSYAWVIPVESDG